MNQEISKEWVQRLRSGEYKQGQYSLRSEENKYCCLGILCEMAVEARVVPNPTLSMGCYYYGRGSNAFLPKEVSDWAKIKTSEGHLQDGRVLSRLNDIGKSFTDIADIIESGQVL